MVIASRSHKLLFFLLIYLSVSSLILLFSLAIRLYIFKGTQIFGPILQIGGDRMMFEGAGETFFYCYTVMFHARIMIWLLRGVPRGVPRESFGSKSQFKRFLGVHLSSSWCFHRWKFCSTVIKGSETTMIFPRIDPINFTVTFLFGDVRR